MCWSFSLHLLSFQRLTKAIQLWSVYLPTASSNFSMSSTWLLKSTKMITWSRHSFSSWSPLVTHSPKNWRNLFTRFQVSPGSCAPSYLPFTCSAHIPARRGLRSATRGSLVKSSARRATLGGRSIDDVGPQIWNRLPPRLPTLIQPDFTPPSKPSSSEKASLYISGLLDIHSNQILYRYRYTKHSWDFYSCQEARLHYFRALFGFTFVL